MSAPSNPDPSLGVFETMLVIAGEPLELDAHLARIADSLDALYAAALPPEASSLALAGARGLDTGRLRLDARPGTDGIELAVAATAIDREIVLPPWERGPELRSRSVSGWRGGHKWADRQLLEELEARSAPAAPLLVDADGSALETARANVFAVRADGSLATPPADGRILPGVTRMRAIEVARAGGIEVVETQLRLEDLLAAREVFLTGSVRGVEPVRAIDGAPVGGPGPSVAATLAGALRDRWIGVRRPADEQPTV
jgi:para-aminobenzoate synthetase/4-amino-4-deoxychorismate lyase